MKPSVKPSVKPRPVRVKGGGIVLLGKVKGGKDGERVYARIMREHPRYPAKHQEEEICIHPATGWFAIGFCLDPMEALVKKVAKVTRREEGEVMKEFYTRDVGQLRCVTWY
jgi:hypothetical protein